VTIVLKADLPPEERKCRNKEQHSTRSVAKSYAAKRRHLKLHAYRCQYCNFWHLTSSAKNDKFNGKVISKWHADKMRRGE
jgi:hypothetical protein